MTVVLDVQDVHVHFGGVRAVDGVTLQLQDGQLHGLVGPNGSGKTTLVNAISRVGPLTSGGIVFDELDVLSIPAHELSVRGLARTFQAIRLIPTLTVRENVLLGADQGALRSARAGRHGAARLTASRAAGKRSADAAAEVLDWLELSDLANQLPGSLSYGTQRRVEIARAVAGRPKLLLLDEPVAGMNRKEREDIGKVIVALRERGVTQLLIEHDLRLLLEICDHLSVMNFGKCVASGEPHATAALPLVQEAYLGEGHAVA